MKKKKRMITSLMLVLVLCVSLMGCGSGSSDSSEGDSDSGDTETLNIVFAIMEYADEPQEIWMDAFEESIEELSDGAITIETHYCGELGDGADQIELIQSNVINMGTVDSGPAAAIVPEVGVLALHWLMPETYDSMYNMLDNSEAIATLEELYSEAGLNVVSWETEGANFWTANKSITSPEDFEGFNMRTMDNAFIQANYIAYGANATVISFSELYSALQLGTVDGEINPASVVYSSKFYEVQDYLIQPTADYNFYSVVANEDFYAGLTDSQKEIIDTAIAQASESYRAQVEENEEEALDKLVNECGMTLVTLTEEEREAFKALSGGAQDEYVELAGGKAEEILEQFLEDLETYK